MFNSTLGITSVFLGVIISSLLVGIVLRLIYRNPEIQTVAHVIVITLGEFGVFCIITVGPILLFSRLFGSLWLFVAILISLIIGLIATSGLNK